MADPTHASPGEPSQRNHGRRGESVSVGVVGAGRGGWLNRAVTIQDLEKRFISVVATPEVMAMLDAARWFHDGGVAEPVNTAA